MAGSTRRLEASYNAGERLIPGVTHDRSERVRCRRRTHGRALSIVDLGCRVGHRCVTLAEIPGATLVGVDSSAETLDFACERYARDNVAYVRADLAENIPEMPAFDYVVARGAIEDGPDCVRLIRSAAFRERVAFDVPYDEDRGINPHHLVHNVRESALAAFDDAEIFFQDLASVIYDVSMKPERRT